MASDDDSGTDVDEDTGTDVSDVESTDSSVASSSPAIQQQRDSQPFESEPISQRGDKKGKSKHTYNRTGSMVIKGNHRSNSSLGNQIALVSQMTQRWGSMEIGNDEMKKIQSGGGGDADYNTDSDYDHDEDKKNDDPNNPSNKPKVATHRRGQSAADIIGPDLLTAVFEKYFAPDEPDIDVDEWLDGLSKLDVNLSVGQQKRIFALMDEDKTDFIEVSDFVQFATQNPTNDEEITSLQLPILESVKTQASLMRNDRRGPSLLGGQNSQDWSNFDLQLLEDEMHEAMGSMVTDMKADVEEKQEFEQKQIERVQEDPELMNPENAAKWTVFEVVAWITELGFERYARYFQQEGIDGKSLLNDLDVDAIERNCGVRTIHARKIMREIDLIKLAVRGVTDVLLDESEFICTHHWFDEELPKKLEQLKIVNELEKTKKSKAKLKEYYESEIKKLAEIIQDLQENGGKKKKKGKKGKKGKHKDKDRDNKDILNKVIPIPKFEEEDVDTFLDPFAGGTTPRVTDENKDEINHDIIEKKEEDSKDENEQDEDEDEEPTIDNIEDDNKEDAENKEDQTEQPTTEKDTNSDSESESESSSSESSDEDEDEGPKHLLGKPQSVLMTVKKKRKGASPKQIKTFLRDLRKKQLENRDTFCIQEVDTILQWTAEEVAYWISEIINFEQYSFSFYCSPIDGDMLLRDLNQEALVHDLGVDKIHSNRILRSIDKLRKIISEGYDEELLDNSMSIHIEPDLERPTQQIIDSLEDRINSLEKERDDIMKELESVGDDDEESGYFSQKIKELEQQIDELKVERDSIENNLNQQKEAHESKIEELNNTIHEKITLNDDYQKQIKQIKKELRRAKRGELDDDDYDESSEEEEEEEEEEKKEDEEDEEIEIKHGKDEINSFILSEMDDNDSFCSIENVLDWSPAEVCSWLKTIQYERYMVIMYNTNIMGDVLLQDLGQRMLTKFKVDSMHIPKLLRKINELRASAQNKGVVIELSQEIKNEMDPNYKIELERKKKEEKERKKQEKLKKREERLIKKNQRKKELNKAAGAAGGGINEEELKEKIEFAVNQKENEMEKENSEQIKHFQEQFDEEKNLRIGFELELEQIKNDYENLLKSGSKQQIEYLQNLISAMEESKIRTVRDLSQQLNSLRIGCRLQQKEINHLKENANRGFRPLDSIVGALGYSNPN